MQWKRSSPHHLTGDLGYKIARFKVGERVMYRPAFGKEFLEMPMESLDEAKLLCDDHARCNREK